MSDRIVQLFDETVAEFRGNRFHLRLIKSGIPSETGLTEEIFKFGISRFWYCEEKQQYLPTKTGHIYLPVRTFEKFAEAFKHLQDEISKNNGKSGSTGAHAVPDQPSTSNGKADGVHKCAAGVVQPVRKDQTDGEHDREGDVATPERKRGRKRDPKQKRSKSSDDDESEETKNREPEWRKVAPQCYVTPIKSSPKRKKKKNTATAERRLDDRNVE